MKRKIPAKKHLGSKDPWKQLEVQEERLKKKKDFEPKDVNSQEVPRKMRQLFRPTKVHKQKEDFPRKKKTTISSVDFMEPQKVQYGMEKPLKPIPIFEQLPGESDKQFLGRSSMITQAYLKRSVFENKFDVDIYEDPESGNVDFVKRKHDELLPEKPIPKKKLKEEKLKAKAKETKKVQKKELLEQFKKEKEEDERLEFKHLKDKVTFGEVVSEPPVFQSKVRKAVHVAAGQDKPGKRNLLLKNLLPADSDEIPNAPTENKESALKLRRKEELEKERIRVQHLYREMKKNKRNA